MFNHNKIINKGFKVINFIFLFLLFSLSAFPRNGYTWKVFGNLKTPRIRFELQPISKNRLLVMGGRTSNNQISESCEVIDLKSKTINYVAPMSVKRTDFVSILSSDSTVYVFGGFDGTNSCNVIERYLPQQNRWEIVGHMTEPRHQHTAITINDSIILIVGGRGINEKSLSTCEIFNIVARTSKKVSSIPFSINCATTQKNSKDQIITYGGRLGGHGSEQPLDVLSFSLKENTWNVVDRIPEGCASPINTKMVNGTIVYTGGLDEQNRSKWLSAVVVESNGKFHQLNKMLEPRHEHWSTQFDDSVIIVGGGLKTSNSPTSQTTEFINIFNGEVTFGPVMNYRRAVCKAISVPEFIRGNIVKQRVLVVSGVDSKYLNSIEILDDSPTISGIINSYSSVTGVGKFPTSQIQVSDGKEFAVGDKVLIAQMQERPFSRTPSNKSLRYDFAGNHEFGRIVSINGNTIALEKQLTHHYSTLGKVQLVRVPEYGDVAVTGELTCKPWDGETGGILAFEANGTVSLQSHINVSGKGFNGAVPARETTASLLYEDNTISTFSSTSSGEGISSSDTKMNSHTLVSNGGESGAVHNSGGAGGANTSCGGDGSLGWVSELSLNQAVASKGGKALEYNGKKVFMGGGGGAGHSDDGEIGTGGNGGGIVYISCDNLISNDYTINANGINGKECSLDGAGGGGAAGTIYLDINNLHYPLVVNAIGGNGGNSVITNPDLPPAGSGGGGAGGVLLLKKHHNTIVAHLDGGQQGIAASVFSEHKAQSGCEGMVLDNVQIVDASSDKPDHKSFIDDCLTEDCSEYKTSKIQIQVPENQQTAETGETSIDIHASTGYVYPNPATDRVTIYGTELDVLSLYDNMGNRFSLPFIKNENSTTIDVSSLSSGLYFIRTQRSFTPFTVSR